MSNYIVTLALDEVEPAVTATSSRKHRSLLAVNPVPRSVDSKCDFELVKYLPFFFDSYFLNSVHFSCENSTVEVPHPRFDVEFSLDLASATRTGMRGQCVPKDEEGENREHSIHAGAIPSRRGLTYRR